MEVARVTSKGQVTIPIAVRKLMKLKEGDKICFFEQDGRIYVENSALLAFEKIQKDFEGEAERLGLETIDDVVALVKEVRAERNKR
ncbi:MAG: type II toxin-antitoxin system PrlF family antitoxin [Clostridiales bacterium]|nr:type II toxin-antitoxin system PrlF family antitoxin [Clostridiales bacterium]